MSPVFLPFKRRDRRSGKSPAAVSIAMLAVQAQRVKDTLTISVVPARCSTSTSSRYIAALAETESAAS
jgi:hypothetical protein